MKKIQVRKARIPSVAIALKMSSERGCHTEDAVTMLKMGMVYGESTKKQKLIIK